MHEYSQSDLTRHFNLTRPLPRSLAREGLITAPGRRGKTAYSFQDLLILRTAKTLRDAAIPATKILRALGNIRSTRAWALAASGKDLEIREGTQAWEATSGQYALPLARGPAVKVSTLPVAAQAPPLTAEAEWIYGQAQTSSALLSFNLAILLEDLNREEGAAAAHREALAHDPCFPDAHFNLSRLYEQANLPRAALQHLLAYRRHILQFGE
jgi:DNA-binding transcriptional MerR regulator